jgi:2-C-methyl-D-erythritol 4-phosphate cytidylyltransferase
MLAWSLEAFARAPSVAGIVVAAPAGHEGEVEALATEANAAAEARGDEQHGNQGGTGVRVVVGGETRAESVARAVEGIGGDGPEFVAVHDAARPLVAAADVERLVAELADRPDADGVIAASALTDTVKRAREPRPARGEFPRGGPTIAKTESREHLWRAETPQVFRAGALKRALKEASPDRLRAATDEAFLVEKAGGKVLMREVGGPNLKVTTPDDLRLAEFLLTTRLP